MNKDIDTIGLVGMRSYEIHAWHCPGANALEQAYWATIVPGERPRLKSSVMRMLDEISAAAAIAATPR